jgi:glutathione synthase/RimK-type ligase-like ATP-grasp enzyme
VLLHKFSLLQLCGYAVRAKRMLGNAGDQSRQAKRYRSQFYRDVWREAAGELGAAFEELGEGIFKISRDGATTRVHSNCTPLDDPVTLLVALDKFLVHTILRSHGLPTPDHVEFSLNSLNKAYQFLDRHRMCVVKPADGTDGGGGVTTGIETRHQLLKAAVRAAGYTSRLLVEEQVKGDILRLLYLDGQLLDAVRRGSPTVVGDGKSKVSLLVFDLNQKRLNAGYELAQVTLKYDMDVERTLAQQRLSWRSVPAKGQRVTLKTVVNDNMADENESVVDQIPESTIAAGRRAAELIGARLAGIDVVTPNVRQGLEAAGGKILEINTTPGYHYHYFKRGGACRVAVPILKTCLEHARRCREDEDYIRT